MRAPLKKFAPLLSAKLLPKLPAAAPMATELILVRVTLFTVSPLKLLLKASPWLLRFQTPPVALKLLTRPVTPDTLKPNVIPGAVNSCPPLFR